MTPAERKALEEIAENLRDGGCTFWACEGADAPPVHMKTCGPHWAYHDLRALLDHGPDAVAKLGG